MPKRYPKLFLIAALSLSWLVKSATAQDSFYKGKTVRIVVGGSAGGGYDTYTRTIARHLGKHIPGNPAFVVENMTGAGSVVTPHTVIPPRVLAAGVPATVKKEITGEALHWIKMGSSTYVNLCKSYMSGDYKIIG